MRLWKRVLALILVLLIGTTGLEVTGIPGIEAKAEYAPYGTTNVPENPGELLSSGEWLYWLDGEYAIIAGYVNTSEQTLKIPAHIAGHAVVGIGQRAFQDHSGLRSVQLHTNITRIAENAFDRDADITLKAFNGSFALWYADRMGIDSVNLSDSSKQTLKESVIDMKGAPSGSYSGLSDQGATFVTEDTTFLQPGSIVLFPADARYPTGLAKIITNVDKSQAKAYGGFEQPEFGDVFEGVQGSDLVYVDWDKAEYGDDFDPEWIESSASGGKTKRSISLGQMNFKVGGVKLALTGKIDLEIGKMVIDYELGVKKGLPYVKNMKVDLPITVGATASLKNSHAILDPQKGTGRLVKRVNFLKNVPLASIGGVINGYMAIDLVFEMEGEFSVSVTAETVYTFTIQNGKMDYSKSQNTRYGNMEVKAEAKLGPQVTLYFVLGWAGFSIRVFEASVGGFVVLEGNIQWVYGLTGHATGISHGEISLKVQFEVTFKIGIIQVFGIKGIYYSKTFAFPIPLFTFHNDSGEWVKRCALDDRVVIFSDYDQQYQLTYDVGRHIIEPMSRRRAGFRFDGWWVDTKLTGWGNNQRWNFSSMAMPYLKNDGALYLCAKWTPVSPDVTPDPATAPPVYQGSNSITPGGGSGGRPHYYVTPAPTPTNTPPPTPPPVPVTGITLDKTSAEFYKGDTPGTVQLTASVVPADATSKEVLWESSNDSVAYVDKNGLVKIGNSGVAVITCRSAASPEITAECTITVKQRVEEIYIESDGGAIAPGETLQLTASCYPINSENKTVTWSSEDESIATVSSTGLVTGRKYGEVTIIATAQDGSGTVGTYQVTVEPELTLAVDMLNDTLYTEGEGECALAYVSATSTSVKRMLESGYELKWSVSSDDAYASSHIETMDSRVSAEGKSYDTTLALVVCDQINKAGDQKIMVTCEAGPYSANAEVTASIVEGGWAEKVTLENTTIYTDVEEAVLLPNELVSKDGKPVPEELSMDIDGDWYWSDAVTESETEDGIYMVFSESGIYEAVIRYQKANLTYEVPVTFYVRDEDGTIHLKVTDLELNESFVNVVEGNRVQLTVDVYPSDAYNQEVVWKSEDESIAAVSQDGVVTAIRAGATSVYCEAQDGSGCFASCAVRVESFLNLDEEVIDLTVYSSGRHSADIETVNVSFASEKRLQEAGLNVTWELQKVSGSATELAVEEFASIAEEGISVSGNRLKLVRISGIGTDEYLLKCSAGQYTDSCIIRLHVVDDELPAAVSLNRTDYQGTVGQVIELDTTAVCTPEGSALPEGFIVEIDGSKAFRNALAEEYNLVEASRLIFAKAGIYDAEVIFRGANYEYVCPVAIQVSGEDGKIPEIIQDVTIEPEELTLLVGESFELAGMVTPSDAAYSAMEWSSYDTSVATVSADGVVTAIDAGITGITLSVPETDIEATCLIIVEDGLTLQTDMLERTVFADGTTRMILDTVLLTESSSKRLDEQPEWTLERVSGNNLTLRIMDYETVSENGEVIYGSRIMLYSVSRTGDAVYNLTAAAGDDSATAQIIIHAVNRDEVLPASLALKQTEYEAAVDELIVVRPEVICWPEGTSLPEGIRVAIEGGKQFTDAVNASDYYVSQSISTLSFCEPGTFDAEYVYTYSNVRYTIPIRFKICDAEGNVPVLAKGLQLNHRNAYMVAGDTLQMDAVFTPADTTNQEVTWSSSNQKVATVTADGLVKAVANGHCIITCTPADSHSDAAECAVTVEDYFTVETGAVSSTLFLQGTAENELSAAWLSDGTQKRLENSGLTPVWSIVKDNVTNAVLDAQTTHGGKQFDVATKELLSGGTATYTLRCEAGDSVWSQDYTLQIIDLGEDAPVSVGLKTDSVDADVGETIELDFTPVFEPANAAMPEGMFSYYVGIGDFYEAMDAEVYSEDGDKVTVAFTRPGRYVLSRQYMLGNLNYTTACTVNVGETASGRYDLMTATERECIVYGGGKSGVVSTISLKDGMIAQEWGDSIVWKVERVEGDSVTVAIKPRGSEADLYVADVAQEGSDQWRVTCSFGGITDSMDIQFEAITPRKPLPESLSIQNDRLSGTIGDWITVPLGVSCVPSDSALPDTGDAFWHLTMDGLGDDVADYEIKNNRLYINFAESGYYTGNLVYQAGNVAYDIPIYFTIEDEEGVAKAPELGMYVVDMAAAVYPEGDTGVVIGKAVMAESLSSYNAGSAAAYMDGREAVWSIEISEGTAAQLSLKRVSANIYDIVLTGLKESGDISYTVKCLMDGKTYYSSGTLHVAGNGEDRPDATLRHSSYAAVVNQAVAIDRRLYDRGSGSVLQAGTEWSADNLLSAMGYHYEEDDFHWITTFYKPGVYTSEVTGRIGNLLVTMPLTITVTEPDQEIAMSVLMLPGALTEIKQEAFVGIAADVIDLRGSKVRAIGASAFRNCIDLKIAYLPDSVESIGDNAFYGCLNLTIYGEKGSAAEAYAKDNNLPFIYLN